jgi:predicted DNA-binding ribbon-helix-helix protein
MSRRGRRRFAKANLQLIARCQMARPPCWIALKEIARRRNMTRSELVAAIKPERQHVNLTSAVRVFVLDFYRDQIGMWIGKKSESPPAK